MKSGLTQKISKIQKEKAEHIFGILSQKVLAKPEEQILKTLRESRENLNKTDIIYEIISSKDEEGTYNPITEMFMQTFLNESENNLKTLYEFKDKNKILAIMQKHTEEMIKTFYQKKENKPIITSILQDPQRIQETIEMGKTVFP